MQFSKLIGWLTGCFGLFIISGFPETRAQQKTEEPLLLIIGADISSSLSLQETLDTGQIHHICLSVEMSGRGGIIALETIGDPISRSFLRCEIEANPPTDKRLPPTKRKQADENRQVIHRRNLASIQVFIDACHQRMHAGRQLNTDLNGFLDRASRLCQEPQFGRHEKIIYVNSDGDHDIASKHHGTIVHDHNLVCTMPQGVSLMGSCWKHNAQHLKFNFESPGGFAAYFHQSLFKTS